MCDKDCNLMVDENGEFTDHVCSPHVPEEEWREVNGYNGVFLVSNYAEVYSVPRLVRNGKTGMRMMGGGMKTQFVNNRGYLAVNLKVSGQRQGKVHDVHALVADAFLGPRPEGMDTCHNDGDKTNNDERNLRRDSRQSNVDDMLKHGVRLVGEQVGSAKYTEAQVLNARELRKTHSLSQLSRVTGIPISTVNAMTNGTNWKYLK